MMRDEGAGGRRAAWRGGRYRQKLSGLPLDKELCSCCVLNLGEEGVSAGMDEERRNEKRYWWPGRAKIRVKSVPGFGEAPRRTIRCMTSDVSVGGSRLALLTTVSLPAGSEIALRIRPTILSRSFRHHAVVRWVRREPGATAFVIGVEFVHPKGHDAARWRRFVNRVAGRH